MKNLEKKILLGSLLLLLCCFTVSAYTTLDPDLGWHLAMGKIILEKGIPSTDPFSYTMASFPFIDHEWLTNTIMWQIHRVSGVGPLVIVFVSLVVATIYFLQKIIKKYLVEFFQKKSLKHSYIVMILSIATLLPFFGIRPQVESWFLFTIWILILDNFLYAFNNFAQHQKSSLYVTAFALVVVWTNLHGSFPLAVVSSIIVTITKSIQEKKIWQSGVILTILVVAATILNPYGLAIWKEILQQMSDSQLRWRISEWIPSIFGAPFTSLLLVSISLPLQIRYYKRLPKPLLALSSFLFIQAVGSVRHVPLWVISSAPLTVLSIEFFDEEISSIKYGKKRFNKAVTFMLYLAAGIITYQSLFEVYNKSKVLGYSKYPDNALRYLQNHPTEDQIFAPYHWGGYLIFNFPEKKVFIDGRMPSWRWKDNPINESENIMDEYVTLQYEPEQYKNIFDKYNIRTVLLNSKEESQFSFENKITSFSKHLGVPKITGSLAEELEKDHWEKIYHDDVAVIYQKKN